MPWASSGNAAGLLYGAVVTAAAIAVTTAHVTGIGEVAAAVVGVLVVYWFAHVYTRVMADRLQDPSASVRESVVHEVAVLEGGLPAFAIFVLAGTFGASTSTAADVALWATVVLLGSTGYAIGRRAEATGIVLLAEVGFAAAFGVVMVALKIGLH